MLVGVVFFLGGGGERGEEREGRGRGRGEGRGGGGRVVVCTKCLLIRCVLVAGVFLQLSSFTRHVPVGSV